MNKEEKVQNIINPIEAFQSEDFTYLDIFGILKRRYKFILGFTFSSIIFSALYALSLKPVFEGDFQIVLQNNKEKSSVGASELGALFELQGQQSDKKTEVAILKSPLVMNPVFKLYKDLAKANNEKLDSITYKKWIENNFTISLLKDTTILNVAYRSSNKETILPILESVSDEYQRYSGRARNLGIENVITYLEEQILTKKENYENAVKRFQTFSLDNNLGNFDGMLPEPTEDDSEDELDDSLSSQRYKSQFLALDTLEGELVQKSAFYKENSDEIRLLKKQISNLEESLKRPKEILIKFKELAREVFREEKSLTSLENELVFFKLDQAKKSLPWELISNPTLSDTQVAPEKKAIVRFWTLIGLLLAISISVYADSKEGIIYTKDKFTKILPFKLLKSIKLEEFKESQGITEQNLNNFFKQLPFKKINFIYLNERVENDCKVFINKIVDLNLNKEIRLVDKVSDINKDEVSFLLINSNFIKSKEIKDLLEDIYLSKIEINSWIYLN